MSVDLCVTLAIGIVCSVLIVLLLTLHDEEDEHD